MDQVALLFEDPEEIEEDEPEIIEYRANFSRTIYGTEYTSITFEAPASTSDSDLDEIAWRELNSSRYPNWESSDSWDSGDTELDEVEGV